MPPPFPGTWYPPELHPARSGLRLRFMDQPKPTGRAPVDGSPGPEPLDSLTRHLAILEALADGVHPFTGEELPDENLYQNAKVLRALLAAMEALERAGTREARQAALPSKAGNPWSEEEDHVLVARFEEGTSFRELAKEHGRTAGAVKSRLTKLGKFAP